MTNYLCQAAASVRILTYWAERLPSHALKYLCCHIHGNGKN